MSALNLQVTQCLARFQNNSDVSALRDASEFIESISLPPRASATETRDLRAEKLKLRLDLLKQLDLKLDPDFNFDDVPDLAVSPPPQTGLPTGVEPSAIADPKARASYEHEISTNQQKAARYAIQKKLHKLNRQLTTLTESHIVNNYVSSPDDLAELHRLVNGSDINDRRTASLNELMARLRKP